MTLYFNLRTEINSSNLLYLLLIHTEKLIAEFWINSTFIWYLYSNEKISLILSSTINEKSLEDIFNKTWFDFNIKHGTFGSIEIPFETEVPSFKGSSKDFTNNGISFLWRGCKVLGWITEAPKNANSIASRYEILFNKIKSSKILGSPFKTPGTSFHIVTDLAFKAYAKIAAEKSEPSLPNVVVLLFESLPIKPCVIVIKFLSTDELIFFSVSIQSKLESLK